MQRGGDADPIGQEPRLLGDALRRRGLSGYDGDIAAAGLLLKTARAQGIFVGSRADYLRMSAFSTQHNLHPVIDRVFALEDYEAALAYMASNAVCR